MIKNRACIGSHSLTSDYIPKRSKSKFFLKMFMYLASPASAGSLVSVHRLSGCGARAWLLRRMWDLSSPTSD